MGPLSAWLMKKIDGALQRKVRAGFEMVVDNFTLGFLGLGLIIASYKAIGPLISGINDVLLKAINALVDTGALPLLSVLNEPAKVLFLNNVIDQGIYYPLGLQVAADEGKSIFFMVASNPGPGLGLLIAFWLFGQNRIIRDSAPGAIIIHFFGGIHEIYFPYVLMKPLTILGMIAGGMAGIATFMLFGVGLTAGPSPGSIFSYLILTPRGDHVGVIAGVLVAAIVSFVVTAAILKLSRGSEDADAELEQHVERSRAMKAEGKDVLAGAVDGTRRGEVRTVVFACDAGMGSSAMGASTFRKRLQKAGRDDVTVVHAAIEAIPADADVVVVHENLADRAAGARPNVEIVRIKNFLGDPAIDRLESELTVREADRVE
ncbi:MAG TPA: PTS mannitol transporter subunit IICB, partial [Nocardioides sp.]|nr:PTS mannitol transporter subunit IICB [Nocardioides sp.]